jgi:hypothetical protein
MVFVVDEQDSAHSILTATGHLRALPSSDPQRAAGTS